MSDKVNRTEMIQIRVTPEMKANLKSAASKLGMTVSGYLLFKASYDVGYDVADKLINALNNSRVR